jgi:hypothetical protein
VFWPKQGKRDAFQHHLGKTGLARQTARLLDEMSAHPTHSAHRSALDDEADAITSTLAELQKRALVADPNDPVRRALKQAWERLADVQRDLMELDREERSLELPTERRRALLRFVRPIR